MSAPRTLTLHAEAPNRQHACRIIAEIIGPALRDYGCTVHWPDTDEPEIAVVYDAKDLRQAFEARR